MPKYANFFFKQLILLDNLMALDLGNQTSGRVAHAQGDTIQVMVEFPPSLFIFLHGEMRTNVIFNVLFICFTREYGRGL